MDGVLNRWPRDVCDAGEADNGQPRSEGDPPHFRRATTLSERLCTVRVKPPFRPDYERIFTGPGTVGALPRDAANGTNNGATPHRAVNAGALRAPTPRQRAGWRAIQQARQLRISRVTVSNDVRATACLDAGTALCHPHSKEPTLTESLLRWTDQVAAVRQTTMDTPTTATRHRASAEALHQGAIVTNLLTKTVYGKASGLPREMGSDDRTAQPWQLAHRVSAP